MKPRWVFRADAGQSIGVGHVVRSISMAAAATCAGWRCELLSVNLPNSLRRLAGVHNLHVRDLGHSAGSAEDATAAITGHPEMISVDGYWATPDYFHHLAEGGGAIGLVDDLGIADVAIDFVINQNPWARSALYPGVSGKLLMGMRYAMLRPEVLNVSRSVQSSRSRSGVTVSMGGTDARGLKGEVMNALTGVTATQPLRVAAGMLEESLISHSDDRCANHCESLPPQGLPRAFAISSLGVLGAGSTIWEAAACGLPSLALVVVDNQAPMLGDSKVSEFSRALDCRDGIDERVLRDEVSLLLESHSLLNSMSKAGRLAVDGQGANRVVKAVTESLFPSGMRTARVGLH